MTLRLAEPAWLILLVLAPLMCGWRPRDMRLRALKVPSDETLRAAAAPQIKASLASILPVALRALAVTAIVLALSQPQAALPVTASVQPDSAMVVALDLSTSMRAHDLAASTSRLEVARSLLANALQGRSDLVGLVAFAGEAIVRLPLTQDAALVQKVIAGLDAGTLRDGTDLAGAMLLGTQMLSDIPQTSRVLVLVTDGAHNQPGTDPAMAARFAKSRGVRIEAVALAGEGLSGAEASAMETVLMQATRLTGGRYFRAQNADSLANITDALQSPGTVGTVVTKDGAHGWQSLAMWCLATALIMLTLELLLTGSRWGIYP